MQHSFLIGRFPVRCSWFTCVARVFASVCVFDTAAFHHVMRGRFPFRSQPGCSPVSRRPAIPKHCLPRAPSMPRTWLCQVLVAQTSSIVWLSMSPSRRTVCSGWCRRCCDAASFPVGVFTASRRSVTSLSLALSSKRVELLSNVEPKSTPVQSSSCDSFLCLEMSQGSPRALLQVILDDFSGLVTETVTAMLWSNQSFCSSSASVLFRPTLYPLLFCFLPADVASQTSYLQRRFPLVLIHLHCVRARWTRVRLFRMYRWHVATALHLTLKQKRGVSHTGDELLKSPNERSFSINLQFLPPISHALLTSSSSHPSLTSLTSHSATFLFCTHAPRPGNSVHRTPSRRFIAPRSLPTLNSTFFRLPFARLLGASCL